MASRRPPLWSRVGAVALASVLTASGCAADRPPPPPRAIDWPAPLVETPVDPITSVPVPIWGEDLVARVELPEGRLGPQTDVAVDPRLVDGISWTGSRWEMERDWDEQVDGGYLDFGAAALDVDGHTVHGFRLEVPAGLDAGHMIDGGGEVAYFEITNPDRRAVNSYVRQVDVAHHYLALGVAGDAIKVGEGSSVHHDAFIEMAVLAGDADDKHYDGAQVFNEGSLDMARMLIDWNEAGTIAATTAAVFTQDDASLTARDIVVLDPGGTWQPVRLSGAGRHDVDDVQVTGRQQPNIGQPGKKAPTAIVKITNGMAIFTLHNEVPGAADWLVETD